MIIRGLVDEDFVNYRVPSMFIITAYCSFKCEKECGIKCCQNNSLVNQPKVEIDNEMIINRYLKNNITKAVVFGGLEPFDQFDELFVLIKRIRQDTDDPIVIYTGYNCDEVASMIDKLKNFNNIIVKFGRFIPNQKKHFDNVLGVTLQSDNQYAEVIS